MIWLIFIPILLSINSIKDVEHQSYYKVTSLPNSNFTLPINLGYSGMLGLRGKEASMFFWYFPAQNNNTKAPLIIWLQGGPGASSMIGLFMLNGPIRFSENLLYRNLYSWNTNYQMLFLDQPVGTGYSFVNKNGRTDKDYLNGYTRTQEAVCFDFFEVLSKIFKIFPNLQNTELIISGESYAGKYIPNIASQMLKKKMAIVGVMIGNGLTDPVTQTTKHGDLALSFGLVSTNEAKQINRLGETAVKLFNNNKLVEATLKRTEMFNYFYNKSGNINWYDVRLADQQLKPWGVLESFLNKPGVKKQIHTGNISFNRDPNVLNSMREDGMKSAKHLIKEVNEKIPILLYQGQFDYRDGPLTQYEWIYEVSPCLKNKPAEHLTKASMLYGRLTKCKAKNSRNIWHVIIYHAGHRAPYDNPAGILYLIDRFLIENNIK